MLNGQFPSVMAPPALGYCYMTPNQFQSCPSADVVNNPQSLAFQCSVDCVVKSKKKSAASRATASLTAFFGVLIATLLFAL